MSKLVIHFENDDARGDFTDWLSDEGSADLDDYLFAMALIGLILTLSMKKTLKLNNQIRLHSTL